VFPVYILHQTVIVVAAYNLRPLGIPPLPEGLLLVALTFAACFCGYEVIKRFDWLRPLFGLKRKPPSAALSNAVPPVPAD
jgi:peptidoglycan/LPS O-acetylase OafA/YrhL